MTTDPSDGTSDPLRRIQVQASAGVFRVTLHALDEMAEEDIRLDDVLQAISSGQILEDYPEHRRGPCCLLFGRTVNGRNLHVVCTTGLDVLLIITVYEPKPPKFPTPFRRAGA